MWVFVDPPYWEVNVQGGSSPSVISEWGVTPLLQGDENTR